jgi:hypothetical protein
LKWWQRPIDEKKIPAILRTRIGASALILLVVGIISTPWLLVLLLALAGAGAVFALAIRFFRRKEQPSILKATP